MTSKAILPAVGYRTVFGSSEPKNPSWPTSASRRSSTLADAGMAGAAADQMEERRRQAEAKKLARVSSTQAALSDS